MPYRRKKLTFAISSPDEFLLIDLWKKSRFQIYGNVQIYPQIYKKGRKDEVNNYRPVSLTCILCKILDSIIRDKVMEHFISNKLFTNKQIGSSAS